MPDTQATIAIRRAGISDVPALAPMFEAYCRFYKRDPGQGRAGIYLTDRLNNHDAIVFIAESTADADNNTAEPLGFALLYPKWQSTAMRRDWTLNDLFVVPHARRRGVATSLLATVDEFARDSGANNLQLKTHHTNEPAHALYQRLGWSRKEDFWTFERPLNTNATEA
ncbi:MAG: GNAT family N-acetyltransferase [Phycisphaerales bacterium]